MSFLKFNKILMIEHKLLSKGRNIIEKIEDIRELGIQNKKQLPNKSIASDPEKKIEELENP